MVNDSKARKGNSVIAAAFAWVSVCVVLNTYSTLTHKYTPNRSAAFFVGLANAFVLYVLWQAGMNQ